LAIFCYALEVHASGCWQFSLHQGSPTTWGNGRLSRVLPTLLLLQAGYAYGPYSSLESVIEHSKEAYDLALRQTQATIRTEEPNWQPWLEFFLRSLTEQIGEVIRLTAASRNTLKQHFRVLVERGTLSQHGRGRGVWYALR